VLTESAENLAVAVRGHDDAENNAHNEQSEGLRSI
jgi:hypothetical protein